MNISDWFTRLRTYRQVGRAIARQGGLRADAGTSIPTYAHAVPGASQRIDAAPFEPAIIGEQRHG